MQLNDHCRKLVSVVVGRSIFPVMTVTASRTWTAWHLPPGPLLDFGPERGSGKGIMADLGPLIRHLVSTRLPSGGRAAFLSPLSPMHDTRPSV